MQGADSGESTGNFETVGSVDMECRNGIDVLDCRKIEDVKIFAGIDMHRNSVFVDAKRYYNPDKKGNPMWVEMTKGYSFGQFISSGCCCIEENYRHRILTEWGYILKDGKYEY